MLLPIILAAVDASHDATGIWVVGGIGVASLGGTVLSIFITRREVESQKADLDRRLSALETAVAEDRRAATVSRARLHDRIDNMKTELSDKTAEVNKDLSDKLANVPFQVVALLNNSGMTKKDGK